ncbi:tryptophan tryptophylquinone biosynthesis enzyme MauG [Fulvimarina endophytica]|uniref:Methylamine utilization protein MauG n=1 Tax=Fulvimarina endophytica TaxID=2293836 RepID=A0A371X003_9HYPH|nr:cytochrome c peroxidase [Fulvimarina endophytica]RFC62552.1 tryptophan tryptophylquinone biosynthesis enzyme MauG [Fulvimarina endophytica]
MDSSFKSRTIFSLIAAVFLASPAGARDLDDYRRPMTIPFEGVAEYSPQSATLGKMLFFDPRLSGAKNMNCATCHNPSFGYETPVPLAIGAANTPLGRQAPTVLNMAFVSPNFWDGRAATLEEQAAGPITAPVEMNGHFDTIVTDLNAVPDYVSWFSEVFPDKGITRETILTAIATYERTIVSGWSPFDRWVEGDEAAVSDSAKRGFDLFAGKARCSQCHSGWNFTDNEFHDIGLHSGDIGRAALEPDNPKALYAFKTPGLRNTGYRAPYMHDGSLADLEAVIIHYENGFGDRPSLSPKLVPLRLTAEERADLIAFMHTLTAEKQEASLPILPN